MANSKWHKFAEWAVLAILAAMGASVWGAFTRLCRAPWWVVALVWMFVFAGELYTVACCVSGEMDDGNCGHQPG
jgi:hypothetical protein